MGKQFYVKVGGEYACFTDPNLKVERVSYPVMTPSAARGVLEAIFWKPAFRWEIRTIKVLKPIKTLSMMRNEIKDRQQNNPIVIEEAKQRQQRISMVLKNVEYVIAAEMRLVWKNKDFKGYSAQFERRLTRGAYHHTPYLGTREFAAWFEPATGDEKPETVIDKQYLGVMFFDTAYVKSDDRSDMRFLRHSQPVEQEHKPPIETRGYPHYLFFPAHIENNSVVVPATKYQELYQLEGKDV